MQFLFPAILVALITPMIDARPWIGLRPRPRPHLPTLITPALSHIGTADTGCGGGTLHCCATVQLRELIPRSKLAAWPHANESVGTGCRMIAFDVESLADCNANPVCCDDAALGGVAFGCKSAGIEI